MSRTYNKHHKSWNAPKREAKRYSNQYRRRYGKALAGKLANADPDDNEMAVAVPKNAGKGDIWIYD